MRTSYCSLIVGLLCSTIPSKQRHIPEPTDMSSSRLNRLSCLQLCFIGRAAQGHIPAECEELCRSRIQTRDLLLKRPKRPRRNLPNTKKECPKLSGDVIPKSDITVNFKKDANGSWCAFVDWSRSSKVKARYKYRLQYMDSYESRNFTAHCIIVQNKTHGTLCSGEVEWTHPNVISLLVSLHHSGNASEATGHPSMYNFYPSSSLIPVSLDDSSEKGYQWAIILGVILGIILATTVIGIVCRKRRDWRYRHFPGLKAIGSDTTRTGESTYMVSYFPENKEYTRKIAKVVNCFRESGYDMIMDVMASTEMSSLGPTGWAEREIRRAAKVLVFFSARYVKICTDCDERASKRYPDAVTRVWYEIRCLNTIFCDTHSSAKMVCILMDDKVDVNDLPTWAQVRYRWPRDCEAIVRRLCSRDETSSTVRIAHATKSDSKSY